MDEVKRLRIHTHINSRYQAFDHSGQLPFSIVFGLCRRSPTDTDPRPLVVDTACSALDVPHALKHKLLTLHENVPGNKQDIEVNVSCLKNNEGDGYHSYVSLSSPVGRSGSKFGAFTVYQYHIDADSELASILEPDKKYTIRVASEDLGVKWYAYGDPAQVARNTEKPSQLDGEARLVNSKASAGRATFKVVPSLPRPPVVTTRMRLCSSEESSDETQTQQSSTHLELSVTNGGGDAISVQTRGRQHFLVPWGPFQPEEETDDPRRQILDTESLGSSGLEVVDTNTGAMVRGAANLPSCGLYDASGEYRPKLSSLISLKPGEPLVKYIDISKIFYGLPDGKYSVRLQSRNAWWCFRTPEEIREDGDDRVPKRIYKTTTPPLRVESKDVVDLLITDGKYSPVVGV